MNRIIIAIIIGIAIIGTTFTFAIAVPGVMDEKTRKDFEIMSCHKKWNNIVETEQINKLKVLDPVENNHFIEFIEDDCLLNYQEWMTQSHPDWDLLKTLKEKQYG